MTAIRRGPADRPALGGGSREDARDGSLEFRILGPFEVVASGELLKLSPRPRKLLVALLLRPETVSADVLIESVWEGAAPSSAAPTLRLYVSKLRRVLPTRRLVTDEGGARRRPSLPRTPWRGRARGKSRSYRARSRARHHRESPASAQNEGDVVCAGVVVVCVVFGERDDHFHAYGARRHDAVPGAERHVFTADRRVRSDPDRGKRLP